MSSSTSRNAFAIVAVLFLFVSTGFSRKLMESTMTGDSSASPPFPLEESGGTTREMIELDYSDTDTGPNTNRRSGFIVPIPDPVAPTPQP